MKVENKDGQGCFSSPGPQDFHHLLLLNSKSQKLLPPAPTPLTEAPCSQCDLPGTQSDLFTQLGKYPSTVKKSGTYESQNTFKVCCDLPSPMLVTSPLSSRALPALTTPPSPSGQEPEPCCVTRSSVFSAHARCLFPALLSSELCCLFSH